MQPPPPPLTTTWLNSLPQSHNDNNTDSASTLWPPDPSTLLTTSTPLTLTLGTGTTIHRTLTPHLSQTNHTLLLTTCFWAPSPSLTALSHLLLHLSAKSLSRPHHPPIRVRIGLSSLSLRQKLLHTASPSGHIYAPATWAPQLGLPPPEALQGLDMQVKSVFVRPLSVMHPKFAVMDGRRAWVPSCNVSWEAWFEGCVEVEGPVVGRVVEFWRGVWGRGEEDDDDFDAVPSDAEVAEADAGPPTTSTDFITDAFPQTIAFPKTMAPVTTLLLPSPHSRNPHFRPFPCQSAPPPPSTPLNAFLLHAFSSATKDIYIQTPNLTAPPVLAALLAALGRGVDVHVLTNRRMMILEQLVTAGTVTELCVWKLVRRHRRLLRRAEVRDEEEERGGKRVGRLRVEYYRPASFAGGEGGGVGEEPVKSHLKMTVVDREVLVLGSGNMDRASWYTSQELGVAFISAEMAGRVLRMVRGCLVGRVEEYYCSP